MLILQVHIQIWIRIAIISGYSVDKNVMKNAKEDDSFGRQGNLKRSVNTSGLILTKEEHSVDLFEAAGGKAKKLAQVNSMVG